MVSSFFRNRIAAETNRQKDHRDKPESGKRGDRNKETPVGRAALMAP